MTFEQASAFGEELMTHYQNLGYKLIELAQDTAEERAQVIIDYLIMQGGF